MVFQQKKPWKRPDFIVKMTGPAMVRPASSDKYKSTSWRAERAFFGREAADRERRSRHMNPTKDFFESLTNRKRP